MSTNLINGLTYLQLKLIYTQTLQGFTEALNWLKHDFKVSLFSADIKQLAHSPIAIVLFGLSLLFVFLIWVFKQEETDFSEIKTSKVDIDSPVSTEKKYTKTTNTVLAEKYYSKTNNTSLDDELLPLIRDSLLLVEDSVPMSEDSKTTQNTADVAQCGDGASGVFSATSDKIKTKRNGKKLLEAASEKGIFLNSIGIIQEDKQLIENTDSAETFILDSVDEIRFVNEKTRDFKNDAFIKITQGEKLTDEMLSHDFDTIKSSEEVDVFIQELEDIMINLQSHTPSVDSSPDNMENLLQFKLSVHFIKVLSNMMQATQLKQFSTCVIGFLEGILDGNTKMTTDITTRLTGVVNFYERYIHLIKANYTCKVEL